MKNRSIVTIFVITLVFGMVFVSSIISARRTLPTINTNELLAKIEGLNIEVIVQSPSAQATSLQIICLFEYQEGDIYTSPPALSRDLNGMVHVDEALHGLITNLRKTNRFEGKLLETLLITPPINTIAANKLLLIGLGNRNNFKPEIMRLIGVTGMREAMRLGVTNYAHASDLKDAGISSPTKEVAALVVKGAIEAYRTEFYLNKHNASPIPTVTKISVLSGPAFFEDSKAGIKEMLNALTDN